jgi:7-cyano-7-deazaguanine synthase in queuosine biosynthesis
MSVEHTIICGGLAVPELQRRGTELALNLWPGVGGGQSVRLRIEDLHARLFREVPVPFHDLMEIATYVYCADQMTPRGGKDVDAFGAHWRRRFHFHIPVRMPELWNSPAVMTPLRELLEFLSEDYYDFTFHAAADAPLIQLYLGLEESGSTKFEPERVMLFSGGLDSLAGAVEEAVVQQRRVVLVNHRSTDKFAVKHRELVRMLTERTGPGALMHLRVLVNKIGIESKEHTQRSRSFLYGSVGAAVAMMLGQRAVRFYENGVVSLNLPVCAQVVGSRSTRTTHPRVLAAMQRLITVLAGEPFTVDNPFLWETRGQIITRILRADCGPMIGLSRSCAHTWETSNAHTHCGLCSQCIDRRFGILAAKAEEFDPVENYKVEVFTQSRPKDEDKILVAAYLERANQVRRVTDPTDLLMAFPEVRRALRHLDSLDAGRASARVLALYRKHALEVNSGVDTMMMRHLTAIRERTLPPDCLLRTVYESRTPTAIPAGPAEAEKPKATPVMGVGETNLILGDIRREIAAVRQDFREVKTVKERLAQMQGEKLFAFVNGIDPDSFRVLCSVLANGDVAKASRALNMSDSTLRSRMADWETRGPAYKVLVELVRWRKEMGRKGTVPLNEAITKGTMANADLAGLLSDVLDEVLEMNEETWEEKANLLAGLLRPHVAR